MSLDRVDLKILDLLQEDGKISNIKLAEKVSLSATAVMARVQKLTKEKYIIGYEARLNPEKLDASFLVFVEVLLDKTTFNGLNAFIDAVAEYPEIIECHMTSGGFDFLMKIRSANMDDYRKFAGETLWQLPGVKETRSYPVMQVAKETAKIKLPKRIVKKGTP